MTALLVRLSGRASVVYFLCLLGLITSLIFVFLMFPKMSSSEHLVVDSDSFGPIAQGILHYHAFSYYPDRVPTLDRGPAYPALIAVALMISNGWWPGSVQLTQCFLFALTVLMLFWLASAFWGRTIGLVAAALATVHPFLLWYCSRIWVETLSMFLFTGAITAAMAFHRRPTWWRALLVGVTLGIAALCKQTFLPFAVILPAALWLVKGNASRIKMLAAACLLATLIVFPWTARNYMLSGRIVPVQGKMGQNMEFGDTVVSSFRQHPFSMYGLWEADAPNQIAVRASVPKSLKGADKELAIDSAYLKMCKDRYRSHPGFLVKKMGMNLALFWMLSETPKKSMVLALLQLPLLAVFAFCAFRNIRRYGLRSIHGFIVAMVLAFWFLHLPVLSIARYSNALIPTIFMYAFGILEPVFRFKDGADARPGGVRVSQAQ
ncbi:MAG: glycosyltransferase family 39 protein [Candidatus Eisenbacteria bacterium]|nr:glycosyltransferase family 39 protein [Candidatus Eisenbacteria bacterium]